MSRKHKVADWVRELDSAKEYRETYGLENKWADLENLFYDRQVKDNSESGYFYANSPGPNIIASQGDALLSSLSVPNPQILIKPTVAEQVHNVNILERLDNQLLYFLGLQEEIQAAIVSAYLWGVGILKIGYDSEFGYDADNSFGLSLSQYSRQGERIETNNKIQFGMPWVQHVLPHDIFVPYGATNCEDAWFIAHRVVRHIEDIRADVKYTNVRDLEPTMTDSDFQSNYNQIGSLMAKGTPANISSNKPEAKSGAEYVELFEIHDRKTGRVYVTSPGSEKFLRNETDALQTDGLPFVSFNFVPKARSFWTTPDAWYLRRQQQELSDIAIQAQKQRRASVFKLLYDNDILTNEQAESFLSSKVPVAQGIDLKGKDRLSDAIFSLNNVNNYSLYQDAEYIRRDAREAMGFSRNQLGEYESSGRRTATESIVVERSSDKRMNRRQMIMRDTYVNVFRKINSLVFKYWMFPRMIEMFGDATGEKWESFVGTDLKGDYSYEVRFASEGSPTIEARRQMALQMYMMLREDQSVDQPNLRKYLSSAFNDPEFERIFRDAGEQRDINDANLLLQMSQGRGNTGRSVSNQLPQSNMPQM